MASVLTVPFNYDSGTFSRKTTSYTIPSGKYAYARPVSAGCTINGLAVAPGEGETIPASPSTASAFYRILVNFEDLKTQSYTFVWEKVSGSKSGQVFFYEGDYLVHSSNGWFTLGANHWKISLTDVSDSSSYTLYPETFKLSGFDVVGAKGVYSSAGAITGSPQIRALLFAVDTVASATIFTHTGYSNTPTQEGFWVKAGDFLDDGVWLLTEYNSIS